MLNMRRRALLALLSGAVAWPLATRAQKLTSRRPKVAILSPNTAAHAQTPGSIPDSFLSGLTELGYIDGQTVSLVFRFAHNALERLPTLAAELVAMQPDVLWTWTSGAARAASGATSAIPIVVSPVNEDTMADLVGNFAKPAGNVTGLTLNNRLQHDKCLQLLKEAAPRITRVGVLINPLNPAWSNYPDVLNEAARALGIDLVRAEARGVPEVEQAFTVMAAQGVDALFAPAESTLVAGTHIPQRILELIDKYRLPSVSDSGALARKGGLLALSTDAEKFARVGAEYVHRILQGAKPSDLPIQNPTEFRLIVNLKAANALSLTIPPTLLIRADELIE
jgi:putative tryptophan/tyrosine transport system substrate-binding protein